MTLWHFRYFRLSCFLCVPHFNREQKKHTFELNHRDNENLMKYKIDKNVLDLSCVFLFSFFSSFFFGFPLFSGLFVLVSIGDARIRSAFYLLADETKYLHFVVAMLKREPQQTIPTVGGKNQEKKKRSNKFTLLRTYQTESG